FWGDRTSTINWCEEDYIESKFLAEKWNTVSNLGFLCLALFGLRCVHDGRLERRFAILYLGLALVGFGSWWFHMTLWRVMQVYFDELPMLIVGAIFAYVVMEMDASAKRRRQHGLLLPIVLAGYVIGVSVIYVIKDDPLIHQTGFFFLVVGIAARATWLVSRLPGTVSTNPAKRTLCIFTVIGTGSYILAFALWNVDNAYCSNLRELRHRVGKPFDVLFQLHSLWHLGTAIGTYHGIVAMSYLRSLYLGAESKYEIRWICGVV
ncbi:alkaline phytoceramidase, partial [Ramicandelaber brevisporus]